MQAFGHYSGFSLKFEPVKDKHVFWPGGRGQPPLNEPRCGYKGDAVICQKSGLYEKVHYKKKRAPTHPYSYMYTCTK